MQQPRIQGDEHGIESTAVGLFGDARLQLTREV